MAKKGFMDGLIAAVGPILSQNYIAKVEKRIHQKIKRVKQELFYMFLQSAFVIAGIALFIAGMLLFLQHFVRLDVLLAITGLALLNVALLLSKLR